MLAAPRASSSVCTMAASSPLCWISATVRANIRAPTPTTTTISSRAYSMAIPLWRLRTVHHLADLEAGVGRHLDLAGVGAADLAVAAGPFGRGHRHLHPSQSDGRAADGRLARRCAVLQQWGVQAMRRA